MSDEPLGGGQYKDDKTLEKYNTISEVKSLFVVSYSRWITD
jgi:hypothetical protein